MGKNGMAAGTVVGLKVGTEAAPVKKHENENENENVPLAFIHFVQQ